MKTNDLFLKAKNDKNLSSMLVSDYVDHNNIRKQTIQLSIPIKKKYGNDHFDDEYIYTDTDITYEDYSTGHKISQAKENGRLKFSDLVWYRPHLFTFLKAIKKDSDVRFKVIAFNSCENWLKVDFVSHQLYGIIDDNYYLLDTYVGYDNSASPISY
jgi:hypothetical protein